jgi:hypothetical protein
MRLSGRAGADRWLARLGELAPGPVIKRVGDRHPGVGVLTGVGGLAVGMIAPDKIAPAGCQLLERQRCAKPEFRCDLGRGIAGTPRRPGG